ncbi:MAG: sensor domain-containing diguanylate cyclase, partial [Dehalococcoidia bacterium]|nr:sensor domain-containing diguanylate cyclase [Dehalococcoidia bacterium]
GVRIPAQDRVWRMGEGLAGWVAQHQQPIVCDDIATDTRIQGSQSPALGYPSGAAVPLKAKDKLLGVVVLGAKEKAAFNEAHLRLLSAYAAEASMALENALLHEEVKRQASTDELTQLANRRFFYQRLDDEMKRARRYRHPLSLMFIDLDELKVVNDRYGHIQGDNLLRHLAAHITRVIRDTDVAARLGGDEFVVLLPVSSREEAASLAERLLREAPPCPLVTGGTIPLGMSIGIAWAPLDGSYDVDLLRLADEAVYRAKSKDIGWDFAMTEGRQAQFPPIEDLPEKQHEDATG